MCAGGFTVVITKTHRSFCEVGSLHLNVVTFVSEEDDVMTEVDAAFALVIAAAGKINDIVITVITNDNIKFFVTNLLSLDVNHFPNVRSCR